MRYTSRPELYDLEYSFKDYAAEVATLEGSSASGNPNARTLLDVACGTGKHLEHLRARFDVRGSRPRRGLLERRPRARARRAAARRRTCATSTSAGTFDVVTCLFSAIGFVGDLDGLAAAARSFAAPPRTRAASRSSSRGSRPTCGSPNRPHLLTHEEPGLVLARVTLSGLRDERISTTEMHYLVATPPASSTSSSTTTSTSSPTTRCAARSRRPGSRVEHDPDGPDRPRALDRLAVDRRRRPPPTRRPRSTERRSRPSAGRARARRRTRRRATAGAEACRAAARATRR